MFDFLIDPKVTILDPSLLYALCRASVRSERCPPAHPAGLGFLLLSLRKVLP